MNFLKIIGFIFLIMFASSCREIFDEDLTGPDSNILVVEGEITDGPGPYKVKLSKSVFFDSEKRVVASNAEVFVLDDLSSRYDFKEVAPGLYYSDSASFRGQIGRIYTLYINTNDSLEYKSTPCTIGPPSKIDSVYTTGEAFTAWDIIYADLSFGSDQKMSTKIDADIALENLIDTIQKYAIYVFDTVEYITYITYHNITKYYTTKPLNYIPVLKTNTDYATGSKIKNIPLFNFYKPLIKSNTIEIDSLNLIENTIGIEFILIINASTISNETFNYYYNLLTQIKGENTFFEPIPTQLIGNIKCSNNSTKAAYGLFQANSIVKKYYKFSENGLEEISGIPLITKEIIDPLQIDTNYYEK